MIILDAFCRYYKNEILAIRKDRAAYGRKHIHLENNKLICFHTEQLNLHPLICHIFTGFICLCCFNSQTAYRIELNLLPKYISHGLLKDILGYVLSRFSLRGANSNNKTKASRRNIGSHPDVCLAYAALTIRGSPY